MRGQGDLKGLDLVILSEAPDSEAAILFESLDEDLEDFFFNAKVQLMSKDENDQIRNLLEYKKSFFKSAENF